MKKPKISTIVITIQFAVILGCLTLLGWTFYQNWFLKFSAKMLASEAGFQRARVAFARGDRSLYEMKLFNTKLEGVVPTDDTLEFTGRHDGPYGITEVLTSDEYPSVHKEIRQTLIDSYNQHMRRLWEKPELFGTNGLRFPGASTNSRSSTPFK